MRIALLADVHANAVALEAVLADLARESVDRVIFLGDVAANGPQPRQVVERLQAMGALCVRGNTEDILLNPDAFQPTQERGRRIKDILQWNVAQLTAAQLAFLAACPLRLEVALEDGRSLLCFHGSPRSNEEIILATTPEAELEPMFSGYAAALFAGAHTHRQLLRRHGDSLILNPGSVGAPLQQVTPPNLNRRPPWAEYAIVSGSSIEFRQVRCDRQAIALAARQSGMPHSDWWAAEWEVE